MTLNDKNIIENVASNKNLFKALLVLFIVLVVCTGIGKYVESPFPAKVTFEDPKVFEDKGSKVVIDRDQTRLTFLNDQGKVDDVVSKGALETQITKYHEVLLSGEYVYVHVVNYNTDSIYIQSEEINCYDMKGNFQNKIYSANYESIGKNVIGSSIKGMTTIKHGISFVRTDQSRKTLQAFKYTGGKVVLDREIDLDADYNDIYKVKYNQATGTFGILSIYGDVYTYNAGTWKDEKAPDNFDKMPADILIQDNGSITFITADQLPSNDIESAPFSAWYLLKIGVYWISRLVVVAGAIWLMISYFVTSFKKKQGMKMAKAAIALVAIAGITGISIYYSVYMQEQTIRFREIQVKSLSTSISEMSSKYIGENISEIDEMNEEAQTECKDMMDSAKKIAIQNANAGVNIHCSLYKKIANSKWVKLAETCADEETQLINRQTTDLDSQVLQRVEKGAQVVSGSNDGGQNFISAFSPITNEKGQVVGMVETASDLHLINLNQRTEGIECFVLLLVGLIGLFFFGSEIVAAVRGWRREKILEAAGNKTPDIAMYRTFMFLGRVLICFDMALVVLISKDIISSAGSTPSAFTLAISSVAVVSGQIAGQFICNTLRSRVKVRTFLMGISVYTIAVLLLTAYSVTQESIVFYFVCLFLSNIGHNAINTIAIMMPYSISNEKRRLKLFGDFGLIEISGGMLGIAIAGYVSDFIGNYAIYLMAIIPVVIYLILGLKILTDKSFKAMPKETAKVSVSHGKIAKFLVSPGMLALVLFIVIPCTLVGAFKTFAFPLFASEEGMSNGYISDYVVIGSCIAFLLNKPVLELLAKLDHWKTICVEILALGLIFTNFYFNTTIVWAVIVIGFVAVLTRFARISIDILWPRLARNAGVPEKNVKSYLLYVEQIANMLRAFVWAAIMSFGLVEGCTVFGGVMVVGIFLFILVTKRLKIRQEIEPAEIEDGSE